MGTGVGEILSGMFAIVRQRFGPLIGLWFAFFGIQIAAIMMFVMVAGAGAAAGLAEASQNGLSAGLAVSAGVFYLIYFLVYCAQLGALSTMASPLQRPQFGEAFTAGIRNSASLLVVFILFGLASFLIAVAMSAVGATLTAAGAPAQLMVVAVLVVALVWLSSRVMPAMAIIPVENVRNPLAAIARSWRLTRGHALTVFLSVLVFLLIVCLLGGALFYPLFKVLQSSLGGGGAPAFGLMVLLFVAMFAFFILYVIFVAALISSIHAALAGSGAEDFEEVFA